MGPCSKVPSLIGDGSGCLFYSSLNTLSSAECIPVFQFDNIFTAALMLPSIIKFEKILVL